MCLEGSDFVSRPRCHNYSLSQINPRTGNVSRHKCGKFRYYTSQLSHWSLKWRKVQQQGWRGNSGNIETNGLWSSKHLEKEGFLLACGETSKTSCLQNSMYKLLNLWVRICLQIKFHPLQLTTISPEAGDATLPELNTWNEFHPTPVQRFVSKWIPKEWILA